MHPRQKKGRYDAMKGCEALRGETMEFLRGQQSRSSEEIGFSGANELFLTAQKALLTPEKALLTAEK